MAVIDSGCPKTVCGQEWLDENLKSTNINTSNLQWLPSDAIFRFGDSDPVRASKKVLLPINIANKDILLETEVVSSNIPLLLSKETMKTAKASMCFEKDKINLFGVEQTMICTSTGHYAIPIKKTNVFINQNQSSNENSEALQVLFSLKDNVKVKDVAHKLHQQFSHPRTDRLIKFVKTAGVENEDLIEALKVVGDQCDTCKRYKRKFPRPVVSLPLSYDFNDTVAMDLKVYKNNEIYFMHIIDHSTRFSAGSVIRSKNKQVIVDEFFKHWVSVFGTPRRILSDNGGEFANHEFLEMCESLNINFITTAAESPWSNGLVEKHNDILGEAVYKILEDVKCSIEVAFCWALNAKNSLQNIYGFSPYQLVFGRNPNLPSVFENKLPALEGVTASKLVASHLNCLHKAREEYIKLEASEKIQRALRSKTRTHSNTTYFNGDEVFYKREGEKRWRGPGRVIGQDGSKILIKIPTGLISAHSCSVMLTSDSEDFKNMLKENAEFSENSKIKHHQMYDDSVESDEKLNNPISDDDEGVQQQNDVINPESEVELQNTANDQFFNNETVNEDNTNIPKDLPELTDEQDQISTIHVKSIKTVADLPKLNQCIQYRIPNSDEWKNVKVTSRGGKVKGVNKFWLNVRDLENETESCVDFEHNVEEWKTLEYPVMFSVPTLKEDKFLEAKEKELANWQKFNVYKEVCDEGQKYVTARWVYTEKQVNGQQVNKARLVCRGYEEECEVRRDSPTCSKDTIRTGITVIASKQWEICSLDIKAAFLNGKLDRDVFMKPPKEANVPGKLWKLERCVYGLNDASRNWYFRLKDELESFGCKCSKLDPGLFIYHSNSELCGIMMIHVDDILWAGVDKFEADVIDKVRATFNISSECKSAFRYLGLEVTHTVNGIYLSQRKYVSELQEVPIENHRKQCVNSPLTEKEKTQLRSISGKLNWLSTETRPDLAYKVSQLASNMKNPTIKSLINANTIIKYVKQRNVDMFFPSLEETDLKVRCFADASYGTLEDGGSQGGVFVEILKCTSIMVF